MNPELLLKLETLRSDFQSLTGEPFTTFFCPILYRDENVELLRAHILNAAFPNTSRRQTVQRKDVDNFYGTYFESEFVRLQLRGVRVEQVASDPKLRRQLPLQVVLGGKVIPHFEAKREAPAGFTRIDVFGFDEQPLSLVLKITREECLAAAEAGAEVRIDRDLRLDSLVSLLKSAHLDLFNMLGYRYAFSPGGQFLGRTILGDFFEATKGLEKKHILQAASEYFPLFVNMVRPIELVPATLQETHVSREFFICFTAANSPWGTFVYLRMAESWHAVLAPIFENQDGATEFLTFLGGERSSIKARLARVNNHQWQVSKETITVKWPEANW